MENKIITPTNAYFKEGEVYVYTLPEEPNRSEINDDPKFLNLWAKHTEACSYARAHPFKVAEKDVKSICMYLYREYSIVPVKDNMMTIGDKVAQDLTEYRIEGLKFKIEEVCIKGSCAEANECIEPKFCAAKKVAYLIEDDGVKN